MRRPSLVLALAAGACVEALPDTTPYVDATRVLAVRFDPAEPLPGEAVQLTALVGEADGTVDEAPVDWSWCVERKPLAELGPVSRACLDGGAADARLPIDAGTVVGGTVPADTCSLFGPNPPPPEEGQPAGRPVDPDVTGGFYQPVIGASDAVADTVLASLRVRCGIANVSQETYVAWNLGYHSNENPAIEALVLGDAPVPVEGTGEPPTVRAGAEVPLEVAWPACPDEPTCGDGICSAGEDTTTCSDDCALPVGCGGAESYLVFDPTERTLGTRREALSVSWFVTDGELAEARGGRAGDDTGTTVTNTWTAPLRAGDVHLWVVLRDERGGTDFASFVVRVVE